MFSIEEERKKIPDTPGVYMHKDRMGQVIYVGKALSLKKRVNQYFQSSKHSDPKMRALVRAIAEFEYITCATEMEAFLLEDNLIKAHQPKYNVLLRDDKTYPYIQLTVRDPWPQLVKTRKRKKDGQMYFGPYTDVGAVNQMVELLNDIFRLKRCTPVHFPSHMKPCLHYHIGYCDGMCVGKGDREEYRRRIGEVIDFLKGKNSQIIHHLQNEMNQASREMRYEDAARFRDYLQAARRLGQQQRVALQSAGAMDVVLTLEDLYVVVFSVRRGKLVGRESYTLKTDFSKQQAVMLDAFFRQHYGFQGEGPREILVAQLPENRDLIQEYLRELWGHKVDVHIPQRGEKKALLDLALRDVEEMAKNIRRREQHKNQREAGIKAELDRLLEKGRWEKKDQGFYRIEAYDISNTNGVDTVGAGVTFIGSKAHKKAYRKFKVKTVSGPDDYGSIQEVLYRRLQRGVDGDEAFLPFPDIIFLDGGKGQVSAAMAVLEALNLRIPLFGLAKDDHHRTRELVWRENENFQIQELKSRPILFSYLGRIQEEVHRFAISYHRYAREDRRLVSVLDEIPGVGPKKRRALLTAFGSVDAVKRATVEELEGVSGIHRSLAEKINGYFH